MRRRILLAFAFSSLALLGFSGASFASGHSPLRMARACRTVTSTVYSTIINTVTETVTVTTGTTTAPPPPPPPPPSAGVVLTEDLGWTPVPSASLPWGSINQLILFSLTTTNGPGLDTQNTDGHLNVPLWVANAHSHPGVAAIIAIGGSDDQNWHNACNDANRAQFVQNLVGYATSNGFDGIDLDMESGVWSAQGPPSEQMSTCIEAISTAAHPLGLLVSADVITNWQGPWYAPSQAYVDQFNLMTYGDDVSQMQADVAATESQGLPASKFVVGVDVDASDGTGNWPPGGCGQFASYAAQAGLLGSFVWDAWADYAQFGNACADGLAAGH